MYLDFYHFRKGPFRITPDPEFLFLSPTHRVALDTIAYGIEDRKGVVAICGEVGLGKTTILRSYLEQVDPQALKTIHIINPNVSFPELLRAIYRAFGLVEHTEDLLAQLTYLHQLLIEEYHTGRNVVLLIDDAQHMPIETLANLRILSNMEIATDKLLQIVLVGQPELDQKLAHHALRPLKQRIAIGAAIAPLTPAQSVAYIQHRLAKVLEKRASIFTKRAMKLIVKQAQGVPRTLNILCDNALATGWRYRQKPVTAQIVKEVIAGLHGGKRHYPLLRWGLVGAVGLMLLGGLFWFSPYRNLGVITLESLRRAPVTQFLQNRFSGFKDQKKIKGRVDGEEEILPQDLPLASVPGTLPFSSAYDATQKGNESAPSRSLEAAAQGTKVSTDARAQETAVQEEKPTLTPAQEAMNQEEYPLTPAPVQALAVHAQDTSPVFPTLDKAVPKDRVPSLEAPGYTPQTFPVTRVVQKGDYLWKLTGEVYGFVSDTLLKRVQEHNPHIANVNRLLVGDRILFPQLPEERITPQSLHTRYPTRVRPPSP
jgi:general secretion pathway protein A